MSKSILIGIVATALLSACASKLHRGVVAMKIDDHVAHVGLNKTEVTVGDHVELYGNKCSPATRGTPRSCLKVSKGHGIVTEVLSDDYAAVKFDDGVTFQEGDFIEKHSH